MQLYLEGGAWFKKKHPWKNKFFGHQKERIIKRQQVSWPEDDVISLRPFYVKHLILIKIRTADPRVTVFIPICNKRYISKPQNKEIGSVSRKTDTPMSFFLAPCFSGWIPIWSVGANHVCLLAPVFKPMREGAQGGAPSNIQVAPVAQRRWCKFLVLEFYWYPT